ncbi:hypothetical protein LCGC14_0988710 [marine sediment metagenome]|uniref:Uncharacterized protein n=1 Tax=marine sediment metagenome TaxID=412755 RepID=A0A0F9NT48_9ZZZZ
MKLKDSDIKPYFQMVLPPRTTACCYCSHFRVDNLKCKTHRDKKFTPKTMSQITCTDWQDCRD